MYPVRRATLLSSRKRRNGMNAELPTMVEPEALDCPAVRKNTSSGDLERRTDPIPARITARLDA